MFLVLKQTLGRQRPNCDHLRVHDRALLSTPGHLETTNPSRVTCWGFTHRVGLQRLSGPRRCRAANDFRDRPLQALSTARAPLRLCVYSIWRVWRKAAGVRCWGPPRTAGLLSTTTLQDSCPLRGKMACSRSPIQVFTIPIWLFTMPIQVFIMLRCCCSRWSETSHLPLLERKPGPNRRPARSCRSPLPAARPPPASHAVARSLPTHGRASSGNRARTASNISLAITSARSASSSVAPSYSPG